MRFGKWLEQEMMSRGITQNKMARETGINQSSINHYITGENQPPMDKAEKLAGYLGYDLVIRKKKNGKESG